MKKIPRIHTLEFCNLLAFRAMAEMCFHCFEMPPARDTEFQDGHTKGGDFSAPFLLA